jgi:hypothetical protein
MQFGVIGMALLGHYPKQRNQCLGGTGVAGGQVGRPGAQSGMGLAAVAAWWVEIGVRVLGENDAPAKPTQTTEMAKTRIARSIISNLLSFPEVG